MGNMGVCEDFNLTEGQSIFLEKEGEGHSSPDIVRANSMRYYGKLGLISTTPPKEHI